LEKRPKKRMRREKIIWKLPPIKKAEGRKRVEGRMEELYTHMPIFSLSLGLKNGKDSLT
jgi:hypothetical protein